MGFLRFVLMVGQLWLFVDAARGLFKLDDDRMLRKKMKRDADRWSALFLAVMLISSFCLTYLMVYPVLNGWIIAIQTTTMVAGRWLIRKFYRRLDGPDDNGI